MQIKKLGQQIVSATQSKRRQYFRLVVSIVFIIAALSKGTDLTRFSREIQLNFDYLSLANEGNNYSIFLPAAIIVFLIELLIGSMLLINFKARLTLKLTTVLISLFIGVSLLNILYNSEGYCSCFGMLIERTPIESLLENIFLLVFTLFAYRNVHKDRISAPRGKLLWICSVAGVLWCILFYLFPPDWSAARKGIQWKYTSLQNIHNADESNYFWMLDVNCPDCLEKVRLINQQVIEGRRIEALSTNSIGRISEFKYDFEPLFPVNSIDSRTNQRIALPTGSLIQVKNGDIVQVLNIQDFSNIEF